MSRENRFTPEDAILRRTKYIEAFAVSLGADEALAKISASALIAANASNSLPAADYTKPKLETDPDSVRTIELMGSWLLTGSPHQDGLKFIAGQRAYFLLKERLISPYFTNLPNFIENAVDKQASNKFKELTSK
ncbi:MAG: hypothetical protein A3D74_02465 [Candidatus Levybacteria bacterium RIFCSPHIGHO2_02_FULL_37_13]|nr:MAG: hypothetical protein A3D74_02465 [Candidatus Levybacteria bacterium RIFCSPHIGHO2_02_FULL_37_13]OGH30417.1 MAG: hypothetical protein A3E40_01375 [Candidatus Levybacteria bacterium RIFCSPHIGHO2_12_FULL_37_9]